jgi:hypothetical protein
MAVSAGCLLCTFFLLNNLIRKKLYGYIIAVLPTSLWLAVPLRLWWSMSLLTQIDNFAFLWNSAIFVFYSLEAHRYSTVSAIASGIPLEMVSFAAYQYQLDLLVYWFVMTLAIMILYRWRVRAETRFGVTWSFALILYAACLVSMSLWDSTTAWERAIERSLLIAAFMTASFVPRGKTLLDDLPYPASTPSDEPETANLSEDLEWAQDKPPQLPLLRSHIPRQRWTHAIHTRLDVAPTATLTDTTQTETTKESDTVDSTDPSRPLRIDVSLTQQEQGTFQTAPIPFFHTHMLYAKHRLRVHDLCALEPEKKEPITEPLAGASGSELSLRSFVPWNNHEMFMPFRFLNIWDAYVTPAETWFYLFSIQDR